MPDKTAVVSVRIDAGLKARMEGVKVGAYPIGITDIVTRGIELALTEIATLNKKEAA